MGCEGLVNALLGWSRRGSICLRVFEETSNPFLTLLFFDGELLPCCVYPLVSFDGRRQHSSMFFSIFQGFCPVVVGWFTPLVLVLCRVPWVRRLR